MIAHRRDGSLFESLQILGLRAVVLLLFIFSRVFKFSDTAPTRNESRYSSDSQNWPCSPPCSSWAASCAEKARVSFEALPMGSNILTLSTECAFWTALHTDFLHGKRKRIFCTVSSDRGGCTTEQMIEVQVFGSFGGNFVWHAALVKERLTA